jgi:hypothetical protein
MSQKKQSYGIPPNIDDVDDEEDTNMMPPIEDAPVDPALTNNQVQVPNEPALTLPPAPPIQPVPPVQPVQTMIPDPNLRIQRLEDLLFSQMTLTQNLTERLANLTQLMAQETFTREEITDDKPRVREPKPTPPPAYIGRADKLGYPTWEFKMLTYLENYPDLNEEKKISITIGFLSGTALTWYRHRIRFGDRFKRLKDLLAELEANSNVTDDQNKISDMFQELKQTGCVADYVAEFENLRLQLDDVEEAEATRRFINGLKTSIKKTIRREEAKINEKFGLRAAMDLALVEDPTPGGAGQSNRDRDRPANRPQPSYRAPPTTPRDPMARDVNAADARGGLRPLTDAQRQYLREKGGCFACRQLGHQALNCPNRQRKTPSNENNAVDSADPDEVTDEIEEENESDSSGYEPTNVGTGPKPSAISPVVPVSEIKTRSKSDIYDSDDWQLNPTIAKGLFEKWGEPKVDLFATIRNKQSHYYFREESDLTMGDGCLGDDAF